MIFDQANSCRFVNFTGNGGALRLGGTVTMENLVFEENKATTAGIDDATAAAGPAISNVGILLAMTNITFIDNTFYCSAGTYVDYVQVRQPHTRTRYSCVWPSEHRQVMGLIDRISLFGVTNRVLAPEPCFK